MEYEATTPRWIRNWLTGRTQRVVIHDETSDPALVTSGVPHGSVLSPLLFIIYINDLDVGIISKINKFADDTKLCHRAFTERDRETIQSNLNCLLQWTETWQMSFNIEKCSVMHVGANNRHFQHTMYNIPIETVQQQKDLGVIVTENLKHDKQVEKSYKLFGCFTQVPCRISSCVNHVGSEIRTRVFPLVSIFTHQSTKLVMLGLTHKHKLGLTHRHKLGLTHRHKLGVLPTIEKFDSVPRLEKGWEPLMYINDLDVGIISKINKFTDDTKLCRKAFTEKDRVTIQSDLNRLLQ
ncbi:Reverse transcriptase domain [Trinorchestia longiramus]|nr:Reverse transcriptase domain [Trinorchestia longiramus]